MLLTLSMIFKSIPPLAWIITAISGAIFTLGVSISTIKATSLNVEFADFKLSSTAKLSKVLELSKELEQKAIALQEQEAAYEKLKVEFDNLKKYNQPIKMLEPAIKEVERVQSKTDLVKIEQKLEQTAKEASDQIAEISEGKPQLARQEFEEVESDRQSEKEEL